MEKIANEFSMSTENHKRNVRVLADYLKSR